MCTFGGKGDRNGCPDAAASSGYNGDTVSQAQIIPLRTSTFRQSDKTSYLLIITGSRH
jgi:hypothetical protein